MISKHFEHNSRCSRIGENDLGAARIGLAVSFGKNGETTRPPPLPSPQGGGEYFVPALSAIGGRYLVEIALKQGNEGKKSLIAFRRAFRPSMIVDPGGDEPILLSDQVSSLSFRYFGSPEKQAEAAWYPSWTSAKVLPSAVEV